MNKTILGIIGVVVIVFLGGAFVLSQQTASDKNKMMGADPSPTPADTLVDDDDGMMEQKGETVMANAGTYTEYSPSMYEETKGMKRVLFFHATWCPTCKAANIEFTQNVAQIPAGVVLLKTDYDTEKELKQKYGITYQHTFVQVDDNGNELAKWNGGGITELTANVK